MDESIIFDEKLPNENILEGIEKKINKKINLLEKKIKNINTETNSKLETYKYKINNDFDTFKESIKVIEVSLTNNSEKLHELKTKSENNERLHLSNEKKNLEQIRDNKNKINKQNEKLTIQNEKLTIIQNENIKKINSQNENNQYLLYTNFFLTICLIGFNYFRR